MHRVMVLNPKGGSGKTTLATSLAGFFASGGWPTVLFDHDAQGSSTRWLDARPPRCAAIHGVAAYRNPAGVTRSWHLRLPPGTERVVFDTPAGIGTAQILDLAQRADSIVVPVLPSAIDIEAVSGLLDALGGVAPVRCGDTRVGLVANRVRARTRIGRALDRFLDAARWPVVARLADSQSYVQAGESGLGIHELTGAAARRECAHWEPLLEWLGSRRQPELPFHGAGAQRAPLAS